MKKYKWGLVLSGGGMRGAAHAGVIKALEEHGIEPEAIAGASAGAIAGSLYAGGHSWSTVLELFDNPALFKWSLLGHRKPGFIDSDQFFPVFQSYFPEDRFEALHKKLYITATDIEHGESRVFSSGPLIRPILASAAYPVVFTPVEIEGVLYADGGIMNNFPVEPLLDQCEQLIGVYVNPAPLRKLPAKALKSGLDVAERAYQLSIARDISQKFKHCAITISPEHLTDYGTFDLLKAEEIFDIGYKAGKKALKAF